MIRPSLVDPNIFKKLSLRHTVGGSLVNNLTNDIRNKLISIFDSYKNLIFILAGLGIFLYFLYKFNKGNKKNKPNSIEVNYIRKVDMVDDEVTSIKDTIDNQDRIPKNILDIVKSKINDYDNISPVDVSNLSGF